MKKLLSVILAGAMILSSLGAVAATEPVITSELPENHIQDIQAETKVVNGTTIETVAFVENGVDSKLIVSTDADGARTVEVVVNGIVTMQESTNVDVEFVGGGVAPRDTTPYMDMGRMRYSSNEAAFTVAAIAGLIAYKTTMNGMAAFGVATKAFQLMGGSLTPGTQLLFETHKQMATTSYGYGTPPTYHLIYTTYVYYESYSNCIDYEITRYDSMYPC